MENADDLSEITSLMSSISINEYLLPEVLIEIFCRLDENALFVCKQVCQQWRDLINSTVWHRKAEKIVKRKLPSNDLRPWQFYYYVTKMQFEINLVENPNCTTNIFSSFALSCFEYETLQTVPSLAGFPTEFFNVAQPPIKVRILYSYRVNTCIPSANYGQISLVDKDSTCIDNYVSGGLSRETPTEDNVWFEISHLFENYGHGLHMIKFEYGGVNCRFMDPIIKIMIPESLSDISIVTFS